jgi:hypothetical protein
MTDGRDLLFREGSGLKRLEKDGTTTVVHRGFTENAPLASLLLNGRLYYSDGTLTGVYANGESRSWGLAVPASPVCSLTIGDLPAGGYQIATTFIRDDGQESGASPAVISRPTASQGGIRVTVAPSSDPSVEGIAVYASSIDGEVLWRQGVLDNEEVTVVLSGNLVGEGPELLTQHMGPPLPGSILGFYRGRIYIADGRVLRYTENFWRQELMSTDYDFMQFPDEITAVLPVEGGIWLGTRAEAMFLSGDDPDAEGGGLRVRSRIGVGVLQGTGQTIDGDIMAFARLNPGRLAVWATTAGIYAGDGTGQFRNLTGAIFVPPDARRGVSYVLANPGMDQYVFSLTTPAGYGSARVLARAGNP